MHFFWIDQFCGLSGNRVGEREREIEREREERARGSTGTEGFWFLFEVERLR